MQRIRDVFATERPIDRPIEKVIDYSARDDDRLEREIREYEVTASVERGLLRFLDTFDDAVSGGDVAEIGVWVSGFYGSGKSSFTKYLGFALDQGRTLHGTPFVHRLADRVLDPLTRRRLEVVARRHKTAVFMMDLGTDQLAESAAVPVTTVLYRNVLRALGFSRERKVADLEVRLEIEGRTQDFLNAYQRRFGTGKPWVEIHDDPRLAVKRAAEIVPSLYPDDYSRPEDFSALSYSVDETVADVARRIIELVRKQRGCDAILFFVDEVGQYVAPRKELILNLDGLVRAFKEIGRGKVWFVATAQQTLTEISEKAATNSPELFKLKDRFPISIELEATDIREITARRLLTKNAEGRKLLEERFRPVQEALRLHTGLSEWPADRVPLDADIIARLYPFLPSRFDLVLDLIRALASRTGGTGLRSAIRLVQDILVDTSRSLPPGTVPFADRPIGRLVAVDDLYDTLRHDLRKEHPQAVDAVERIAGHPRFKDDALAQRAAKAVAVLQPLDNRTRSAENIAALLYAELGAPGEVDAVRDALHRLVDAREFGLVELRADVGGPGGAGFLYLSDEVQPLQKKRDAHEPTVAELNTARLEVLRQIFENVPSTKVEGVKTVQAGLRYGRGVVAAEASDVIFRLDEAEPGAMEARLDALVASTQTREDQKNTVYWLFQRPVDAEERLVDACRSRFIQAEGAGGKDKTPSSDVSRFLRSEERRADRARDAARAGYEEALLKGWFVFRGRKYPVEELGKGVLVACAAYLDKVAASVFEHFSLVKKHIAADVAAKFLEVDRLDKMPKDRDPLGLVQKVGRPSINKAHPALAEAMRAFREQVKVAGSGRVQGNVLLELFAAPPYGWSKDTTRYLFAALLMAGEIEVHSGDGVLRTTGPKAIEALRNTQSFGRVGVAPRGEPVPIEALDRASRRLERMFNVEVLPLEDQISRVVRTHFPTVMEQVGSLPDRLRLLGLPGEARARTFLQTAADLLKEDAGGAASLLGAKESRIPEDEKWAAEIVKLLDGGGEREIAAARQRLRRLRELADLFPSVSELAGHPAVATIDEILGTEVFHERIADLREACRTLEEALRHAYEKERDRLATAIEAARRALEAQPAWIRIGDEDRAELRETLDAFVVEERPVDLLQSLQIVQTRLLGLPLLEEELRRRTEERAVPPPAPEGGSSAVAPRGAGAQELELDPFLPEDELRTPDDVERWLRRLREHLLDRLQEGPVRLVGAR